MIITKKMLHHLHDNIPPVLTLVKINVLLLLKFLPAQLIFQGGRVKG